MKTLGWSMLVFVTIVTIVSFRLMTREAINKSERHVENLDWLIGNWERLHEEQGMETYENWQKLRKDAYSGIGFTVRGTDTIKQENLQIAKQNGKWIMIVKVPEESDSIKFPITLMKTNEFICTNDSMDFPKEIRYWKNGDRMNALVSGDSLRIDFEFKKLE